MTTTEKHAASSKTIRAAIKAYLADSSIYDAGTMQITAKGDVTARPDQNKAPGRAGGYPRLFVGGVREIYAEAMGMLR